MRKGRDKAPTRKRGGGGREGRNPWKSTAGRKLAGIICIFTRARQDDVFHDVVPLLGRERLAFTISPCSISAYVESCTSKAATWLESWCAHHERPHGGSGRNPASAGPNSISRSASIDQFGGRRAFSLWCVAWRMFHMYVSHFRSNDTWCLPPPLLEERRSSVVGEI